MFLQDFLHLNEGFRENLPFNFIYGTFDFRFHIDPQ